MCTRAYRNALKDTYCVPSTAPASSAYVTTASAPNTNSTRVYKSTRTYTHIPRALNCNCSSSVCNFSISLKYKLYARIYKYTRSHTHSVCLQKHQQVQRLQVYHHPQIQIVHAHIQRRVRTYTCRALSTATASTASATSPSAPNTKSTRIYTSTHTHTRIPRVFKCNSTFSVCNFSIGPRYNIDAG